MNRSTRRRRLAAAFLSALAVAGTVNVSGISTPATGVPGVPSAQFDPQTVAWASYRDQSSGSFSSTFASKSAAGYLPLDLDIETSGGYRVGSVWQKNLDGRSWKEKRNLTSAQFSAEWNQAVAAGQRLVEQETYVVNGTRLYAGIWVENKEGAWASHRGQTNAQFLASFAAHRDAGLMPVDYDEYATSSGLRYNTVWVKAPSGVSWKLYRGLSSSGYGTKFAELDDDYRVLAFDSLKYGGTQRYAGIWVENTNGRHWAARRDMSAKTFDNHWHRYADQGFRLVGYNRYQTASGTRYAGIWRQNSARPDWALRSQVDARVATELAKGVPGISVAVYQDGQPVYLRGFGSADVADGTWMDATHVGSLASVSKAVAGVLTLRMQRAGDLDLGDETRDWVPTMPAFHTHTVGELLSNRGCVRHYVSGLDDQAGDSFATALAASQQIWSDALVCNPAGDTDYNYSTHGYTFLGAALEAAGGDDIKDLVRTRLTTPYGLGTLRPQSFASSVHRMSIYHNGEVSTPNNDWKVLGGGLDSSATDLARFGAKLIGGQILNAEDRTQMWTAPNAANPNYAYGWDLGSEDGTQVVAKGGSWTGNLAYLRLYPQKGISVAVMMNSRNGDWSATQLGRDIGSLVLDTVD